MAAEPVAQAVRRFAVALGAALVSVEHDSLPRDGAPSQALFDSLSSWAVRFRSWSRISTAR